MLILDGPPKAVKSLAFGPDGAKLYATHDYVGVHVHDLAARSVKGLDVRKVRVFGEFAVHPGGRWALGRRPNPRSLSDNDACVIDLEKESSRPFNFLGVVGQQLAFSPDGGHLVTLGHSDYDKDRPARTRGDRLYCWKMTGTGPRYAWHRDAPENAVPWFVVYLGDDRLVTADMIPHGRNVLGLQPTIPRLCVRSAADGKPLADIDYPDDRIEQLLASPDGRQVVARRGTAMWVWDAADWKRRPRVVEGKTAKFLDQRAAAFHPTGPYLLLAINGPSVQVFDTATWKPVRKWKWDVGVLKAVAISPDGALAAAAGPRGRVVVWDLDL